MIFAESNSRDALRGELLRRKSDNPQYSMNAFARRCGISVGYLSLLLSGKRKFSRPLAERIAASAKLSAAEKDYFLLLVRRERADDELAQRQIDSQIRLFRERIGAHGETLKAFDVISDWYYSALLEYFTLPGQSHGTKELSRRFGLAPGKIGKAIKALLNLGLIKKNGDKYQRIDAGPLRTSTEVRSLALRKFHKQILKLGIEALDAQPIEKRSCTGATIAIDPSRLPEAKKMILGFQRELMAFLQGGESSAVYQLQIQLFELLKSEEGK